MISRKVYPERRGRRFLTGIAAAGLVAGVLSGGGIALAVHDEGVFELEGNAVAGNTGVGTGIDPANPQSQPAGGDDWDAVYAGSSGADTTSIVVDLTLSGALAGQGDSILSTNTKDIQEIADWDWKQTTTTSAQDKADIEHAFAAQYSGGTDVLLYFGADRFSNSGDTVMGFWFFKDKITTIGPDANGDGTFDGDHTARDLANGVRGDILIVSDFRAGGKAPNIQIYEWVTSGGSASTHLDQIGGGPNPASCTQAPGEQKNDPPVPPVSAGDPFCATANQYVVTSPWPFLAKANSGGTTGDGGPDTKYGVAEFMEGGINMTALGLGDQCFSSFLAETRSSHSVTSTLSDFALGGFGSCGASLATQTSKTTLEIGQSAPTDTATITVSGAGGNPPAPVGDVSFYLCGPSATQITSCTPSGSAFDTVDLAGATVSGNEYSVTSSAPTITSAGYYCFAATWPGDDNYDQGPYGDDGTNECFQVTPKQPTISTQVNDAGPVVPGTELSDTATLGNTATPSNGTNGTITFTAYGPEADATTCNTVAYSSTLTVTGNGSYLSSDGDGGTFAPTAPGFYNWIAAYTPDSGDVNNLPVSGTCGDANEGSVVQQYQPSLNTAQTWTVKDSATVTVSGGGNLDGTVTFELHDTNDCSGTPLDTQNIAVSGASPQTVGTVVNSNTTFTSSQATLYWNVSYTSNNGAHKDIAASCTENSSVTINN